MAGCATASLPESMVPTKIDSGVRHAQSAGVVVAGGSATSAMGKSQISNEALQQAIVASLEKAKTFASVVKGGGGDYPPAVTVVTMDQPSVGLTFTVKLEAAAAAARNNISAAIAKIGTLNF